MTLLDSKHVGIIKKICNVLVLYFSLLLVHVLLFMLVFCVIQYVQKNAASENTVNSLHSTSLLHQQVQVNLI